MVDNAARIMDIQVDKIQREQNSIESNDNED